jgi:hypothetical protein
MTRTPTQPLDDKRMWRKALARTHPDGGGDHDLFIWMQAARDAVCNRGTNQAAPPPPRPNPRVIYEGGRVPFPEFADFEALTARALEVADGVSSIFAVPLRHLGDCRPMPHLAHEQERGASYKRLAYIAHLMGMSKSERIEWYRVAESVPLADRHAGHVLSKLKRRS